MPRDSGGKGITPLPLPPTERTERAKQVSHILSLRVTEPVLHKVTPDPRKQGINMTWVCLGWDRACVKKPVLK